MFSCKNSKEDLRNIVYILADDMGYGDLSCLNPDSKIPTPNMDRIYEEMPEMVQKLSKNLQKIKKQRYSRNK